MLAVISRFSHRSLKNNACLYLSSAKMRQDGAKMGQDGAKIGHDGGEMGHDGAARKQTRQIWPKTAANLSQDAVLTDRSQQFEA